LSVSHKLLFKILWIFIDVKFKFKLYKEFFMTLGFQPGAMLNTLGFGNRPENVEVPHYDIRVPNTADILYPVGKWWLYVGNSLWYLQSLTSASNITTANWVQITTSASVAALFASPPAIGTTTPAAGAFTTLAVSGLSTLTGGINTAPVVVAAGASPQTANGRSGQVTFSGVSIAAGATQSFVINNTSVAAIGTVIMYTMVGATTGAALTIQSVTNVAGTSSTIVVTNGTGATTSTANITFTFIVLN
jgi:hypothetical protein